MRALASIVSLTILLACSQQAEPTAAEPAPAAEPPPAAEPAPEPEPAPAAEAEAEAEPAAEPAAEAEAEPAAEAEQPAAAAEPAAEPASAARPSGAGKAKRAAEPEPAGDDKPSAEPEAAAEPVAEAKKAAAMTGPCGEKGQPMCPLQAWMERHLQQPFDDGELAKVATNLHKVKGFSPDPGWNGGERGWVTSTEAGIAAAEAGDEVALKRSCKSCHKAWRKKYKAEHRKRGI